MTFRLGTSDSTRRLVREICNPPNLMSLARLPLAIAFPWVAGKPMIALAILALAGLTDVLDGWLARRSHHVSVVGQIIDPVADKAFALSVVVTLVVRGALPIWSAPILLARELVEAPLALIMLARRRERRLRVTRARANVVGKADTVVQFSALACAIGFKEILTPVLMVAAVTGVTAAVSYLVRELGAPETSTPRS